MVGISTVLSRGSSSFELNLIFIYFSSESSEILVIDLIMLRYSTSSQVLNCDGVELEINLDHKLQ